MQEIGSKRHSKVGFFSFTFAVLTFFYALFLFSGMAGEFLVSVQKGVFPDARGENGGAVMIFGLALIVYFFIPIAGHLIGFILGLIGLTSKQNLRIFAVIGTILNLLLPIGYVIYIKTRLIT